MRTSAALLVAVALTAAGPVAASAEASSSNTTNIGPMASGPSIAQGSAGFDGSGTQAQASSRTDEPSAGLPPAGGAIPGSDVTFKPIPFNALPFTGPPQVGTGGAIVNAPAVPVSACPAGQTGFFAFGPNGTVLGTLCVGNAANPLPGAPAPTAVQLAEQASAQQPWPSLQVGIDPRIGLTGLTSRFWLAGNAQMPDATASAGALNVSVHATVVDVLWTFGDGGTLSSGPDTGRPGPAPSGIQHLYQTDTFDRQGGYAVSALLRYRVTYSVNGGPPIELGVKGRPYSTSYAVNQLQPEAVSVP
jgi:hypothetical protein